MAGVWAHVALTYVPTLANGGRYLSFERVLTLLLLCTGVGSALLLCGDNVHEVPALWTLIVLPQRVLGAALAHAYKDDAVIARRVPLTQLPGTGKELPTSKSKRRDRSKVGGISGESRRGCHRAWVGAWHLATSVAWKEAFNILVVQEFLF